MRYVIDDTLHWFRIYLGRYEGGGSTATVVIGSIPSRLFILPKDAVDVPATKLEVVVSIVALLISHHSRPCVHE